MATQNKLSKKFFYSLETGVYLVSNCHINVGINTYSPAFYEYILPPDKRHEQWQRIKEVGADQRQCFIYSNAEEYKMVLERDTLDPSFPKFLIIEKTKHL